MDGKHKLNGVKWLIAALIVLGTLHGALAVAGDVLAQFPNGTASQDFVPSGYITYSGDTIIIGTADANGREVNVTSGANWNGKKINATIIIEDPGTAMSSGQNFFWGFGDDESVGPNSWDVWFGIGCGNAQYGSWQTAGAGCGVADTARVTGNVTLQIWADTSITTNNVEYYFNGALITTASVNFGAGDIDVTGFYHGNSIGANWNAYNYTICEDYCSSAPPINVITAQLNNNVSAAAIGSSVTFSNVTGALSFDYFNITSSGFCVTYTGNGTGTNCTAGSGSSEFFNVTLAANITGTETVEASTFQGYLSINATQLYTGNAVQTFNITNDQVSNTTTTGTLSIKANNGSNNVLIDVPGNYSMNATCTGAALTTSTCTIAGIYDNLFKINATDALDGSAISTFTINASQTTLGSLGMHNTTNGTVWLQLLQGYSYLFVMDAGSYALQNATTPANASTNFYEFVLLPTNSIFLFFYDEETLDTILENVTVTATQGATVLENSSMTGEMILQNLTIGTWELDIDAPSYQPRKYFVTVTARSSQDLDVYLVNATNSAIGEFIIKDADNANKLTNATVTMAQKIGTNWVSIAQAVSDAFGATYFDLISTKEYRFTVEISGYETKTGTFVFQEANSPYTIIMDGTTSQSFTTYSTFSYTLAPDQVANNQTTFTLTTSSPDGTLDWFAVVVKANGTTLDTSNVTGSPSGGQAAVTIDLASYNQMQITATYYVKDTNDDDPLTITRAWLVWGQTPGNYTLIEFLDYYGEQDDPADDRLSDTSRGVMVSLTAAGLAALLGWGFGILAATGGAALVFLIAMWFSWIPLGTGIIVVGALVGIGILGARGSF